MPQKPFHHTEIDRSKRCQNCRKPLKKNLLAKKKKTPDLCYKCSKKAIRMIPDAPNKAAIQMMGNACRTQALRF